jgi:hypothetical protein
MRPSTSSDEAKWEIKDLKSEYRIQPLTAEAASLIEKETS